MTHAPDFAEPTRFVVIGRSKRDRVLFVVHSVRESHDRIRIISAREASAKQRKAKPDAMDGFDWSRARRGHWAGKFHADDACMRQLEPDLARAFPDSESVNAALRELVAIAERTASPKKRKRVA